MKRVYGWRPDLPSQVPWFDHARLMLGRPTPPKSDNRKLVKWVYDQGDEGSCTANSGIGAERFFRAATGMHDLLGSRQFLYYVTRSLEGTTTSDAGATIADTIEAETKFGVCLETVWPYAKPLTRKPSAAAYKDALNHQLLKKAPVAQTQDALESVLAARRPLHYGMSVYETFESAKTTKTGVVPMPKRNESVLGGHALWLFDYDRIKKLFYGQNSWGAGWGQDKLGLFSIPYAYILDVDYASDFWTISGME